MYASEATRLVLGALDLQILAPQDPLDAYLGWLSDTAVKRFLEVRFQTHTRTLASDNANADPACMKHAA